MKSRFFAALALAAALAASAAAPSAGAAPLADVHAQKGVACASCHTDKADPAKPPRQAECLACHGGSYEALAQATKAEPNPHRSHLLDRDCTVCHKGHQPSELACSSCHKFSLKMPNAE